VSERFAGRYLLLRPLGQGGMGEVFLARDLATGAECALKRLSAEAGLLPPDALAREFEALTRVRHPEIVAVHELGFAPDGTPFYTMEYVPGLPADRAIARGDWAALCFTAARIAHGLEALHAAGVFHGDLKPSNVLVVPGGARALPAGLRLLDFGLAALLGRERRGHRGTPGYAAPEVVRGEEQTVAADLYGLGATLYALIAGRPAYEAEDVGALLHRQQAGPPSAVPLEEAGAPPALAQLVLRLMAPAPAERPRDAREVRREIERVHPAARRPLAERLQAASVIGREREFARLGPGAPRRARLAFVTGEAGAGKSVLLDAVAARAALAGEWVARLSCAGSEGAGAPARALLRRLAAGALADPAATEPESSPVRRALEGAGGLQERDLEAVVEAAAGWIRAIAERAGAAVVLLDDTESFDPSARAFLRRLALHPDAARARWVWAGRPSEAEDGRMLVEAGAAEWLELGALTAESVGRLAAARLGEPAPPALTEWLWARAEGHPGLTVELLRGAAAAGAIEESEAGLAVDAAALERVRVPGSFETSLLGRIEALPPGPRAAAVALAVWGRAVAPAQLAALDPASDVAATEALERAGLAARDDRGRLRLSPPALGERVLHTQPAEARSALHRRLLEVPGLSPAERFRHLRALGEVEGALEAAEAAMAGATDARLAAEAAVLAEHDFPARAADWHERLAQELVARGRYAAAIPHLERALELDGSSPARPARWHELASACFHGGRVEEVERVVNAALAESPPDAWRARLLTTQVSRLRSMNRLAEALEIEREALKLAVAANDDEAIGACAHNLGLVQLGLGQPVEAEAETARAAEAYGRAGNTTGAVRALIARATIAGLGQRMDEAERMLREALAAARAGQMPIALEDALIHLAAAVFQLGRWEEARQLYEEAQRVSLEHGRPVGVSLAMISLTQADGLMGQGRGVRRGLAALRLARGFNPRIEAYALRSLAVALRTSGRRRRARGAVRRALALARRGSLAGDIEWSLVEHARLLAADGRWGEVGVACERAIEHRPAEGSLGHTVLEILSARAALRGKADDLAARRLGSIEAWLGAHPAPYGEALAEQLRAEMALAQGRTADGIKRAEKALAGFAALPAPPDRAMAALDLARLALEARGETRAPVGDWLDQAASTFERLGDHRNRERALALMVRWLRRADRHPATATPERNLIEAVSRLLNSLSDLRELTQRAMRMAVEQLDAERGVLLLTDPVTGELNPIAEYGALDATTRNDAVGYSRRVARRVTEGGGALLIGDAPSDPRSLSDSMVDMRLRSIVCVPMFLGGKVVGAVYLDDSRRPDVFSGADRGLLEGFAQLMAVAIESSRAQEEAQRANESLVGENLSLRQEVGARFQTHNIIGSSAVMQRVMAMTARAAMTDTTVLMTGENGTGKELIARVIHHSGKRRLGPFVSVNCGAIPETLLESELFGILPNVATGVRARDGRFVQAKGGTLFLDEIGEMPPKQQVALLSAISSREITPLGGGKPIPVDVRIIAATNRDLVKALEEGAFREDLYYRLNVIPLEVPPLRDRKADIPALAQFFVAHFAEQQEREVPQLSAEFVAALMQSDWPGNVRELQNYIERILAMSPGPVLYPDPPPRDLEARAEVPRVGRGRKLSEVVARLERKLVMEAIDRASGNQSLAARELGMTEQSIRYKIRKYGLVAR
jgi:transcriptional regulator with GAF, ATPase, and Fis domain